MPPLYIFYRESVRNCAGWWCTNDHTAGCAGGGGYRRFGGPPRNGSRRCCPRHAPPASIMGRIARRGSAFFQTIPTRAPLTWPCKVDLAGRPCAARAPVFPRRRSSSSAIPRGRRWAAAARRATPWTARRPRGGRRTSPSSRLATGGAVMPKILSPPVCFVWRIAHEIYGGV
jgi:hypothetical protein